MKIGLTQFGLVAGAFALLAGGTMASTPTFEFKLAGIKKVGQNAVMFRDITCDPAFDECETLAGPGSKCVATEVLFSTFFQNRCSPLDQVVEMRCVGGSSPGASCTVDTNCGVGGTCRRLAVSPLRCDGGPTPGATCNVDADCGAGGVCKRKSAIPLLCDGGPTPGATCAVDADCGAGGTCARSFVEPGDQIILEAFLSGWDNDLNNGICNGVNNPNPCEIGGAPCPGRHCENDFSVCTTDSQCTSGQRCVRDECVTNPLLGGCQWTVDSSTYVSLTNPNPNAAMVPVSLPCTSDADCRHGLTSGQCTCGLAVCDPTLERCSAAAGAYIDRTRADFLYKDLPGASYEVSVSTALFPPDYVYAMSALSGLVDEQRQEYVGALWLQVTNQAAGTYELGFLTGPGQTIVTNERAQLFPAVDVTGLRIEIFNPCEGFDIETECPEPLNVCRVRECVAVDGVATCAELNRDCDQELGNGSCCVIAEGGCVDCRACCNIPPVDVCRVKSQLQCIDLGGDWREREIACGEDVCTVPAFCPGTVDWASSIPPTGVQDSRQPSDVNDSTALQGIDVVVVTGDPGAEDRCFSLCETVTEDPPNDIADVVEDPPGTYTISLIRRITPGGLTAIKYDETRLNPPVGTFKSLPADADANGTSNVEDIIELVECCLNQNCVPAHGDFSCDLDRSGGISGADVLREIDMLHGAGDFSRAWDGELLNPFGCE